MTRKEVSDMVKEVGIPTAYYQFPENSGQQPPFICFYYPSSDDVMADNINYVHISPLIIELYTEEKDFAIEKTVEGVLTSHGISYRKIENYIDSERMYQITYETEVVLNE